MDTDDYWLWEIWLLTISYRCIFDISESPENWRSRAHLTKTYLGFRTQGAEERWHTLPWAGFWSIGVYFLSPVLFPWPLTLAFRDASLAIWRKLFDQGTARGNVLLKRGYKKWWSCMTVFTVLRHRIFNPLSGIPTIFFRGTTQIKKEHLIEGHHIFHMASHDGYSKDNQFVLWFLKKCICLHLILWHITRAR